MAKKASAQTGRTKPVSSVSSGAEIRRVGKFGIVGILNTLIDFGIFNVLQKYAHFDVIGANLTSTTCAMAFSFIANKKVVFKNETGSPLKQLVIFFAITAFGLYIIQSGIIYFLVHTWTWPAETFTKIVRWFGITLFTDEFYIKNSAKAVATIASLTWNYIMYKKVVFK